MPGRTAGGRPSGTEREMRTRDEGSRDATPNRGGARSMAEAYCVKDKMKVEVQNPQRITMKNGKPALQGTCPQCGGKVFKIGGRPRVAPATGPGPRRTAGADRFPPDTQSQRPRPDVPIGPHFTRRYDGT